MGSFDFNTPYSKYLRKGEGKSAGMKRLEREVETEEEYKDFCQAVENITELYKRNKTERQFMKMWSTFCNCWRDYVDRKELGLPSTAPGATVIAMPVKLKR